MLERHANSTHPLGSEFANECLDAIRHGGDVLVGPDSDDPPPFPLEREVRVGVTPAVAVDLCSPPLHVLSRQPAVKRASVPVAAVHKHGHARPGEDDVRPTSNRRHWAYVHAVSKSAGVQ